jgi:DNA-binding LytR/AlgR family response regulator
MTVRAVIADDEPLMRDQLRARLAEVWPELEIVGEARNGIEAVEKTLALRPDLVFLDIRMPGKTGVEAAREIAAFDTAGDRPQPEIVFVTAFDQYAIEAFEQGVIDYVLKPADRDRLQVTVERIRKRLDERRARPQADAADGAQQALRELLERLHGQLTAGAAPGGRLKWIQASVGQQIVMIPVDEILFFVSDEKYTRVQTAQQEALIRKPIKELIDELDPKQFWQIHRSTLVNASAIAGVSRDFRGRQLVLIKGRPDKLEVSRSYTHLFKSM